MDAITHNSTPLDFCEGWKIISPITNERGPFGIVHAPQVSPMTGEPVRSSTITVNTSADISKK